METIMEPDELKHIWQALGRQLERQEAIHLQLFRERKLQRARGSLHPLFWGQIVQILFGCLFLLLATLFWSVGPHPAHVVLAGIVVHAYGIGTIIVAGMTLGAIRRIDYAAPVVAIQKQLASLRRLYLVNGMVAGLPWWFLWVPGLLVLAALGGHDLYATAPAMVWIGLGIGVAGLLATWAFHRWSRSPARAGLGRRLDDAAAGGSIRAMQGVLDEIARFEQE